MKFPLYPGFNPLRAVSGLLLAGCLLAFTACQRPEEFTPQGTELVAAPASQAVYASNTGGYANTVGAGTLAPVTVTNLSELQAAFRNGKRHIVVSGHISGGAVPLTFTFASTAWNNTTIEGAPGGRAVLNNIQLKFSGERLPAGTNIMNLIIRNISFYGSIPALQALPPSETDNSVPGAHAGIGYLGVSFRRCSNVWFDHCSIFNTSDNLWCATLLSDYITVSYCHFYFTRDWVEMSPNPMWNYTTSYRPLADMRLCAVLGAAASDSYTYGGRKLHITLHHNRFGPLLRGRPLCRGYVHFYNNYFDNGMPGGNQLNAIQVGSGGKVYSEGNYFYQTVRTNLIGLDDATYPAYTFAERDNVYNTSSRGVMGAAWPSYSPVPYSYELQAASTIPDVVQSAAGPR